MVAAVLLFVGCVLFLNGIWLIGQTYEIAAIKLQNKEIAVMNSFTGGLALLVALYAIFLGGASNPVDSKSVALGSYVLLFAFTYIWVAINQLIEADGRALGWYCLFVAITAVPTGLIALRDAGSDPWLLWLGIDWLAWAVLWFLFFLLLSVRLPIARFTGFVVVLEGILTAWIPSYLLIQGYLKG